MLDGEHVRLADVVRGAIMATVAPLAVVLTGLPWASLADAPPMVTLDEGAVDVLAMVRAAVARIPSERAFWFKPYTMQID